MTKEIGTVSQKYRRIELALQKATPAKVKELVKEMIQETLPMFEEGRNPTILNRGLNNVRAFTAWKKKVLEYFKLFPFEYNEGSKNFEGGMKDKNFSVSSLPSWDEFLESLKQPKKEKTAADILLEIKKNIEKLEQKGMTQEQMLEELRKMF